MHRFKTIGTKRKLIVKHGTVWLPTEHPSKPSKMNGYCKGLVVCNIEIVEGIELETKMWTNL
jgi:hypothetical protein